MKICLAGLEALHADGRMNTLANLIGAYIQLNNR
jgi:hypothetical protein